MEPATSARPLGCPGTPPSVPEQRESARLTCVDACFAKKLKNLLTNGQKLAALLVPQYQIDLWPTLSESTVTDPLTMIKERLPRPVFFDGPDRYDALKGHAMRAGELSAPV
jgi:hypothetical protein